MSTNGGFVFGNPVAYLPPETEWNPRSIHDVTAGLVSGTLASHEFRVLWDDDTHSLLLGRVSSSGALEKTLGPVMLNGVLDPSPNSTVGPAGVVGVNDDAGPAEAYRRTYIVYGDYDSDHPIGQSPCPSTSTRFVTWYIRWNTNEAHTTWSTRTRVAEDPTWRYCVGPSFSATSTKAPNSTRPAIAVDPISKDLYVAIPQTVAGGMAGIAVHKASHADPTAWTRIYTSREFTSGPHDSWAPAISVKRNPGSSVPQIAVSYYTTEGDYGSPSKNEFVNMYVAISEDGGINWQDGHFTSHPNWALQGPWGRHNGLSGHPYWANGLFWGSWTDDRGATSNTEIYAAAAVYN